MAVTRMTLQKVLASITDADRERLREAMANTTEEDIRRHMIEDGEDPDAPLPPFQPPPDAKAIRAKLGMSQVAFAALLGIRSGTQLRADLFEQVGKSVRLTEAGRVLDDYATRILALIDEARVAMDEVKGLLRGRLLLGATPTPGTYLLPALLGQFKEQDPQIEIVLRIRDTRRIQEMLLQHELHLGMIGGKVVLLEPLLALVARRASRPVALALTRSEEFLVGRPAPASIFEVKIGAKRDGLLTGIKVRMIGEPDAVGSAYVDLNFDSDTGEALPEGERYGDGSADLAEAWWEDESGERQTTLHQGRAFTFKARVRFKQATPKPSIAFGRSDRGPHTPTSAPIFFNPQMLERATRECSTSPQMHTLSPASDLKWSRRVSMSSRPRSSCLSDSSRSPRPSPNTARRMISSVIACIRGLSR